MCALGKAHCVPTEYNNEIRFPSVGMMIYRTKMFSAKKKSKLIIRV